MRHRERERRCTFIMFVGASYFAGNVYAFSKEKGKHTPINTHLWTPVGIIKQLNNIKENWPTVTV